MSHVGNSHTQFGRTRPAQCKFYRLPLLDETVLIRQLGFNEFMAPLMLMPQPQTNPNVDSVLYLSPTNQQIVTPSGQTYETYEIEPLTHMFGQLESLPTALTTKLRTLLGRRYDEYAARIQALQARVGEWDEKAYQARREFEQEEAKRREELEAAAATAVPTTPVRRRTSSRRMTPSRISRASRRRPMEATGDD